MTAQPAMSSTTIEHEKGAQVPAIKTYADKFLGHVVVITGAGSGIGETTARLFAQQGAQLVLFDVDKENLQRVRDSIHQAGGKADFCVCDVSNEQNVIEAIETTILLHHKIDILANLAGIFPFHPLTDFPTEMYRRILSINVDGSFFLTRAVLPYMQKAGYGRIVLVASGTFNDPPPGLAIYVASKAAVIGFTRAVAVEAGVGITANVVLPGLINTPGVQRIEASDEMFQDTVEKQVVKRKGHPLDIAYTICFLASPEAAFITGQSFNCNGGQSFG